MAIEDNGNYVLAGNSGMGKILQRIEELSGGTCFQTDRYTLDHFVHPEYQDKDEEFHRDKVFETDNPKKKKVQLRFDGAASPLFSYFLDGSRRTYKIVDFGSTDGKFLPIVAGQIGAAVCLRQHKKLKPHALKRANVLAIPDRMAVDLNTISEEISGIVQHHLSIDNVLQYKTKKHADRPFENLAIAKIQTTMMDMEVELIRQMVSSNRLATNRMLMVDGSLQFSGVKDEHIIFQNVVGVSKTFNPNLQGILKSKNREIGNYLTNLELGERTAVYVYEVEGRKSTRTKIGAWYLRIRPKENMKKPLDGVIKIEKIATQRDEQEDGFDTDMINEISRSILLERNVTCYGNDDRWANHLYPIYLTELYLKNSFVSDMYFLNIF